MDWPVCKLQGCELGLIEFAPTDGKTFPPLQVISFTISTFVMIEEMA